MEDATTKSSALLAHLAAFAAGFDSDDAPEVVHRQAALTILDTVGCMVSGLEARESTDFARAEVEAAHGLSPVASVAGRDERTSIQAAIRTNAYLGDVFELNDLTGGHAGIAVVPAALAFGESLGRTGKELLDSVVVGIEVTSRVYAAYYPTMKSYEETGIAPPGIPSTLGATAAVARLHRLSAADTERALSVAAALAGWCPAEVIFGQGGTIKPMLFGSWPGAVAADAVRYAKAGFSGPSFVLESPIGLYATLAKSFDSSVIEKPATWYLAEPRRKRHACCGYIHSAIDGVLALRNEGVDVMSAARIEIGMPAYIIPGVSKSGPPTAPNEARFHAEFCVALAALGADAITPDHSIRHEEHMKRTAGLMSRIRIVEDKSLSHYHQSNVRLLDADGGELASRFTHAPKGAPLDPMTDDEVRQKFRALTNSRMEPSERDAYLESMSSLASAEECSWIVRSFHREKELT